MGRSQERIIHFTKYRCELPYTEVLKLFKARANEYRKLPGLKYKYYVQGMGTEQVVGIRL